MPIRVPALLGPLCALLCILSAAASGFAAESLSHPVGFTSSEVDWVEVEGGRAPVVPGAPLRTAPGVLALPHLDLTFVIPEDRTVVSARWTGGRIEELPGGWSPVRREGSARPGFEGGPHALVEILGEAWWHGYRLARVRLNPVEAGQDGSWRLHAEGDLVLATAFGAGFHWGAMLLRF